ncbi:SURF1 family protein [Quadrisphaera sp. KR29]|uniref:SURF1 family protein n=1 Tax=Quadrisphaera sp. KR29 TaxID=3461391 RepID=UPI004044991C
MLRTALRPANLGLLVLMVAAAVVFSLLGEWQLGRSQEHARISPTEVVVPVGEVLQPAADFTGHADHQRVSVSGTWADLPVEQAPDRELGGRDGSWVVAALQESATGGLLPVVLGWLPAGAPAPPAPTGPAELTGRLMLSEQPAGLGPGGQLRAVSSGDLVNVWPGSLYTGYLLADPGAVAASAPGGALTAVPSQAPVPRLDPQNLSYAFQWWLFAVFALVMWVKIVRDRHGDELEDRRLAALEAAGGDGGRDGDGGGDGGGPDGGAAGPAPRPAAGGLRAWEDVTVPDARQPRRPQPSRAGTPEVQTPEVQSPEVQR